MFSGEVLISVCIFELQILKLLFGGAYTLKGKFSAFDGNRLRFVCFFFCFCSSFWSIWFTFYLSMRNKRRLKQFSNDWNNLATTSSTWKPFINDEDYLQRMTYLLLYWGQDHVLSDTTLLQIWHPRKQMNRFFPFICVASAKCRFPKLLMLYFPLSTAEDFKQTLVTNCFFVICVNETGDIRLISYFCKSAET